MRIACSKLFCVYSKCLRQIVSTNMSNSAQFSRLPSNVVPVHYDLEIKPNLEKFTFEGKVAVNLEIKDTTQKIILHSLDLAITKITFKESSGGILNLEDFQLNVDDETLTLNLPNALTAPSEGKASGTLQMEFTGEINNTMKGFYRSKYFTSSGEERHAAVTQFCPTDARRCFPCWDEPALKATFDVTLIVPENRTALSNMPVKNESELGDGMRKVEYETTPIMSTYLLAFVVGEYDYVEGKSEDGVAVRVYTPLGKKEQGNFALEVTTKALPFYKDYFKIAYPLPKIDLIALADCAAGAMENWGLVTYRETRLLVDSENTALLNKQSIALTVSHELAHQWFGNLVTMEWWTDIWLNEGYATFMEFFCVDHIFPDNNIWAQFSTDVYTCALELDCLQNSHPIEIPINHPDELNEIFDTISYKKGASIIRMLYNYIGDEYFRKGMNLYLTRFMYKNASTKDLWTALGEVSEKPILDVMSTWTKQMGYPVVTVDMEQDGVKRFLNLTQSKFSVGTTLSDKDNTYWLIPLMVANEGDTKVAERKYLMDNKSMEIFIDNVPENAWIKLNSGSVSYFRTKYSEDMLKAFIPTIKDQTLPPSDRLSLLDDLFAMSFAGKTSAVQVLDFINAYKNETNFTVWSSICDCLGKFQLLFAHTDIIEHLNEFAIHLFTPISEKLGWIRKDGESQMDTFLRGLLLSRLVSFNCRKTLEEGKRRFDQHVNGTTLLPADLRSICYKSAMKLGDEKTFNNFVEMYTTSELNEEKDRIAQALGSSKNINILRKVIDFALSEKVRNQDSVYVLVAVAVNPVGRDLVWDYFKSNHELFMERYTSSFLKTRLAKFITENFTTEERAEEVKMFFKEHPFAGTERTVSQSVETIQLNSAWLQRDLEPIRNYFQKNRENK